jgi:hypothetical protein
MAESNGLTCKNPLNVIRSSPESPSIMSRNSTHCEKVSSDISSPLVSNEKAFKFDLERVLELLNIVSIVSCLSTLEDGRALAAVRVAKRRNTSSNTSSSYTSAENE